MATEYQFMLWFENRFGAGMDPMLRDAVIDLMFRAYEEGQQYPRDLPWAHEPLLGQRRVHV